MENGINRLGILKTMTKDQAHLQLNWNFPMPAWPGIFSENSTAT
jgi:hypothetical protein